MFKWCSRIAALLLPLAWLVCPALNQSLGYSRIVVSGLKDMYYNMPHPPNFAKALSYF